MLPRGGWIGVTTNFNFSSTKTWTVRLIGQTGHWRCSAGGTDQTIVLHRPDQWATENLQNQLQAPLDFWNEPNLMSGLGRWSQVG
jgi:hypothetical protein